MELQVQFKGTPAEFGVVVDLLETKIFIATQSSPFMIFNVPKPDANPVYVQLYSLIPTRRYIGDIAAQKTPNGSILFIRAKDEEWENIQASWKILRDVLEEQGWIDPASTPGTARNKGGRPPNPNDAWAWEQVNVHAKEPRIVFLEWQKRNQKDGRELQDEKRSYRNAINKRKKRRKPE
jgi:hypothetical protein